jgi:hypothetical protein
MLFQVVAIQPSERWMCEMVNPEVLSRDLRSRARPPEPGPDHAIPLLRQRPFDTTPSGR